MPRTLQRVQSNRQAQAGVLCSCRRSRRTAKSSAQCESTGARMPSAEWGAWRLSSSNQVTSWASTVSASELGAEDIVAFERVHEGLGELIARGAISGGGDRHEAERMRVERGSRRRVLGVVITEPLGLQERAQSVRSIRVRMAAPLSGRGEATQAGTSRSWQSSAIATETTSPLQHGISKLSEHHPLVRRRDRHLAQVRAAAAGRARRPRTAGARPTL